MFAVCDFLGPDTVTGFIPGLVRSVETHGEASITLTDGPSAVGFPLDDVIHCSLPFISTNDISLGIIVLLFSLEP